MEEGTYYINSYSSRKFMVNTSTENTADLILSSATVEQFGHRMAWDVSFIGNGKYMIQSRWNKKYLSVTKDSVSLIEIENEDNIPAEALFTVGITGSNYTLRSGAGYYLTTKSTGLGSSSGGSETKWRLCLVDRYTELNSCQIKTLTLGKTEAIPLQSGPNNAVFSTLSDFNFMTDTTLVSVSGKDITANGIGEFTMQVHHIPTGRTFSCSVLVEAVYMYLVSTPAFIGGSASSGELTGHAFLYFVNNTVQTVTIGHSTLLPGDGMSIGKFGQSEILPGYDGSLDNGCREGIWYNAEIKQYYATERFDGIVAVCNAITLSELETVSEYICTAELTDDDDYRLLSNNCTHFAIGAWNTIFESTFSGIWTPGGLADEIEKEDGYISDLAFYSNSEQYGYYDDENEVMLWLNFE